MIEKKRIVIQWYSTSDRLPENQQEVLIYCQGQYNLAVFDKIAGGFILKGGAFFNLNEWAITWTRIGGPLGGVNPGRPS
jgi:hypothetical protein